MLGLLIPSGALTSLAAYDPTRPINDKSPGIGGDQGEPPTTRKVALGISMRGNRDMATLDGFTASNGGNKPALWSLWLQWGLPDTRDFPTQTANALRDRGVTPFLFWEPWDPRDEGSRAYRYERIVAGDHDGYIRTFARDAKAFGGMLILRFAHEANGGYFPWVVGRTDNTVEQYLAAWRHIWTIFDQEGADNVKFLWSVAKEKCHRCNPYAPFYPGDQYVDYMGFSAFNWGAIEGRTWQSMYDTMALVTNHLMSISNKPIIVAETGSNDVGGYKGGWIEDGYQEVYDKLPKIVAIMYLNYDLREVDHPDWSLSASGDGLAKYALISGMSRFQGKLTLKSADRARALARLAARQKDQALADAKAKQLAAAAKKLAAAEAQQARVRKGSAGAPDAESGPVRAQKARTTKPSRHEPPAPPQTLDTMER